MDSIRQQKVNSILQRELATLFQRNSRTLFHGAMISVTVVRVSPDMSHARVYISIFAPGKDRNEIMNDVKFHTSHLRGLLGREVGKQLRIVPELTFYLDDSLDYAENINRLLND